MEYLELSTEPQTAAAVKDPSQEASGTGPASSFCCYICGEPSSEICAHCTRDTCDNHICDRCLMCSDCCACDERPR